MDGDFGAAGSPNEASGEGALPRQPFSGYDTDTAAETDEATAPLDDLDGDDGGESSEGGGSPKKRGTARPTSGGTAGVSSDVRAVIDFVPSFEDDLVVGHGARVVVRPQVWEGRVVWAKLQGFPWWPAQVLVPGDPFIPLSEPVPRSQDPVPVRFFGTYDFAWIGSQKCIVPFFSGYSDKVHSEITDPEFITSVLEAQIFQLQGVLPEGFELAMNEQDPVPPPMLEEPPAPAPAKSSKSKKKKAKDDHHGADGPAHKKAKGKKDAGKATKGAGAEKGKGGRAANAKKPEAVSRAVRIGRQMGLLPPADSPFVAQHCIHPDLIGMVA